MFRRIGIPEPVIGHTSPAGECHIAVDDENLAVGAVVDLLEGVPVHRVERADLRAGALQPLDVSALHRTCPDGVDDQADLHSPGRGVGERGGEVFRDLPGVVDIGLEVDPPPCLTDGIQHRGEDLDPVDENLVLIAPGNPAPGERGDVVGEDGVFRCDTALDVEGFLILRQQQGKRDDDDDDHRNFDEYRRSSAHSSTKGRGGERPGRGVSMGSGERRDMPVSQQ